MTLDIVQLAQATVDDPVNRVLSPYMYVFFMAFILAFALTPTMRWLAVRGGIVDWPDLKRKSHIEPVAYLGGVAIFMGWAAGLFISMFIETHNSYLFSGYTDIHVRFPIKLFVGAAIITITGLCDDVYGISPRVKLGGQIIASAVLASEPYGAHMVNQVLQAVSIQAPAWFVSSTGTILLVFFVLGGCNSINLIDGLDGLAAGISAIATAGFLFMSVFVAVLHLQPEFLESGLAFVNDPVRLVLCLALLGALLGYLPYNFNPATIFMGDAGSLLLGYLGSAMILMFADVKGMGALLVMAAIIVFAVPISDTLLAIVRRLMRGQPIFSPDSHHLHHMLIRSGFTVRKAVLTLYAMGICFAFLGCSLVFLRWRYVIAVFIVLFGFILVTAYKISHRQMMRQKLAVAQHAPPAKATPVPPKPSEDGSSATRVHTGI
ncbi:MAG: hypothetical protein GC164_08435 [Phycisphaera sp.]|nr:hypothetical protein [Phycisphaera sp.]